MHCVQFLEIVRGTVFLQIDIFGITKTSNRSNETFFIQIYYSVDFFFIIEFENYTIIFLWFFKMP